MSDYRYIGKPAPRPEGLVKAAGQAVYIHDLERPGMLYGKVKFSEHVHARIKHIDTSRAEKLRGVRTVITAYNTPEVRIGFLRDNFALKKDKVRQYRDEVAAVAAIDPDIAAEAIELIQVEYEPLPGIFDPFEALKPGAQLVHEVDPSGRKLESNVLPIKYHHDSGDIEAGRRASKHVAEGEYSTPWIQQTCMGTAGCIAEFDMQGNLTIWAKTQIPFLAQRDFIKALGAMGLRDRNATVIVPVLGGGFGTGLDTHAYEYIAMLLAWRSGRAVKIVYDREEEFANLSPRQNSVVRIRQGCDGSGKLTFRDIEVILDNGAYTSWGATFPTVMMLPATSLYRVPNVRFDAKCVYTNNTYSQAMRGYGNPELAWALECNIDELAAAAGVDPYEMRLLNCNEPNETTPMGLKVTTCGLRECLTQSADKIGWKDKRGKQGGKKRGVGMASLFHVGGSGRIYRSDASGCMLKIDDFGNVNVFYGGVEMGQGLHSVLTLTVAEALGVKPQSVFINQTNTSTCPWDVGTHASRGAFMSCNAGKLASERARERIFTVAETLFAAEVQKNLKGLLKKNAGYKAPDYDVAAHAKKENFDMRDGVLFLRDAPREAWMTVELGRILRAAHFRDRGEMITAEAFVDPASELPDFEKGFGNMSATYAYGVQAAEVEVDTDTGEVKILKLVAVHDVGKVLNPQTLNGQMYGALAQGLGYALTEQVVSREGKILNPGFRDYKIPTACEMGFPIELGYVETDDAAGPFGAKGIGEPGLVPTAPAIANAIYDAIGVRMKDLPMTPERVLAAIQGKAGGD
jgi:CO/xanthine dehydrogenase Mo-binding subunit